MHPSLLILAVVTALAAGTPAQHPMGFSVGWDQPDPHAGSTLKHSPRTMFLWQGFGFDSEGNLHATGMARQHF